MSTLFPDTRFVIEIINARCVVTEEPFVAMTCECRTREEAEEQLALLKPVEGFVYQIVPVEG